MERTLIKEERQLVVQQIPATQTTRVVGIATVAQIQAQTQTILVVHQTQVEHPAQPILEEIRAVVLQVQAILVVILVPRITIRVALVRVTRVVLPAQVRALEVAVVRAIRVVRQTIIRAVVAQVIRVVHLVIVQEVVVRVTRVVLPAQVRALEAAVADRLPLIQEVDKNDHKKRASSLLALFY